MPYELSIARTHAQVHELFQRQVSEVHIDLPRSEELIIDPRYMVNVHIWGWTQVAAWRSANVIAHDNSYVAAREQSNIIAHNNSRVKAVDNARVTASGTSHVIAHESASIDAYGNCVVGVSGQARVRGYQSSRVVAWGAATVNATDRCVVTAHDVTNVIANGHSTVHAFGASRVVGRQQSSTQLHGHAVGMKGSHGAYMHQGVDRIEGVDLVDRNLNDLETWLKFYNVTIVNGSAILYKAVDQDLTAGHSYRPTHYPLGRVVTAPDWRDDNNCGGGLHLSPSPVMAAFYALTSRTRFLRCNVPLQGDIAVVEGGVFGTPKLKTRSLVVDREVNMWGEPIEPFQESS